MPEIFSGYRPGLIGRIAQLHGEYYAREWNFTPFFEAKVATGLSEFVNRFDPNRDGLWSLTADGVIEGGIAIDGKEAAWAGAHLRWFIMSDAVRGKGYGSLLLSEAVSFCRSRKYGSVFLWTFKGLDPAKKLYEKAGFRLVSESEGNQWGTPVAEQKFVLDLSPEAGDGSP